MPLSPLHRVVAAVVALGATATAIAAVLLPGTRLAGVSPLPPFAVLGLLALTTAGELTYVRLRHGGSTEELTLFEAAVVVDVLLLPPAQALLVPLCALAIASAVRRRSLLKAVFNLGSYGAATAVLVAVVHVVAAGAPQLGGRSVVALTVGTAGFAVVNLLCLSRVLAVVEGVPASQVVREGAPLSAFMALGNVALGSVAVALAGTNPALLPFTSLPAVALTFAYRKAAQEADERVRSARLLELSQLLAGGHEERELVGEFLRIAREAFHADEAIALVGSNIGASLVVTADGISDGPQELGLDSAVSGSTAVVVSSGLPRDWTRALVVPVEAEGHRLGVVALGRTDRGRGADRGLGEAAALLTSLASALGVALRAAHHHERLVEETSKLKAVVDHSSEGILVLDATGRVLVWNASLAAATGVDHDDAAGRRLRDVISCTDPDGAAVDPSAVLQTLTPDAPHATAEIVVTRADGEERWLRLSHAAIHDDGDLTRDVVVAHDITRERQVDRLKSDFIATISHELRTPMTPIRGYADLLRRRGEDMTPEKRAECLDVISDRILHLGRLVEDLLLASRITDAMPDTVTSSCEDLVQLTRRAVADFPVSAGRLVLEVPDVEVPVRCDTTRTIQVLGNLVSNALKYSGDDTTVNVLVTVHDDQAAVTVSDSGRGIPADQLESIFDKFHRVEDPMTMTTGGTGLGLYIARRLATAMNGTIEVHSQLGVGSTFTVTLPRADVAADAVASVPAQAGVHVAA